MRAIRTMLSVLAFLVAASTVDSGVAAAQKYWRNHAAGAKSGSAA